MSAASQIACKKIKQKDFYIHKFFFSILESSSIKTDAALFLPIIGILDTDKNLKKAMEKSFRMHSAPGRLSKNFRSFELKTEEPSGKK